MKSIVNTVLNYLYIAIPMSALFFVPVYLGGEELGEFLIKEYSPTIGLYIRPLVMSAIYIGVLTILLTPMLEGFNETLWFKKLTYERIKNIYKTYIYALSSFFLITLFIVLKTVFFYTEDGINWFSSRNYLYAYLLIVFCVSPFFLKKTTP